MRSRVSAACFLQIGDVEVAHAERPDLALVHEVFERAERLGERHAPAPVQQIAVEIIRAQAPERLLAGADRAGVRRVRRQHSGDEEERFARQLGDRVGDEFLRAAVAVHLGRIDVHHAEIDAGAQRANRFVAARTQRHVPRALTDDGNRAAAGAERS